MFNNERLEKRLSKSFWLVSMISAVAAIVGLIAVILVAARYSYALTNFGFAQGDIGKALFEFADVRSSLRASIGYVDEDAINNVVKQHEENKRLFEEYFAQVEKTIVSEEGRETYDEIKSELDAYWTLDAKIMEMGATSDPELSSQAQEIALSQLSGAYNSIYQKLESLLEVKVNEGNELSNNLKALTVIMAFVIVSVIEIGRAHV